jgi:hypothetical protein
MGRISEPDSAADHTGEGGLDPQSAARLLAQTRQQAERGLDFRSPWLSLLAAAAAFIAFGAIWLSVRGQHPYKGPTAVGLVGLYAVVLIRIATVLYAHRRATAGVTGRSARRRQAEGAALVVALIVVYVLMAALAHAGASDGIVYGVYVSTATLVVLGSFWAAQSAAWEDWHGLGLAIAIMLVAAASAFAGPRAVWLSDGVGLGVVLLAHSAIQGWLLRASRSDA